MILAIDAGHGFENKGLGRGYDPGAIAGGMHEADVTLLWALSGKHLAKEYGIGIVLTRDDDRDTVPVFRRDDIAKAKGATHFVSIHCDSASPAASGTTTFFRDTEDKAFATLVHKSALIAMGLRDRGIRLESQSQHDRLAVLDFPGSACLLELGFLTNPTDRKIMLDRQYRIIFWRTLFGLLKGKP